MAAMTYLERQPLAQVLDDLWLAEEARACLHDCEADAERDELMVSLGDIVLRLLAELERRGALVDLAREFALAG